jgi:methylmalonyl-CoA/ethylmalonyl-CoA epimerase
MGRGRAKRGSVPKQDVPDGCCAAKPVLARQGLTVSSACESGSLEQPIETGLGPARIAATAGGAVPRRAHRGGNRVPNAVNRIHHMGFVVHDLDATLRVWEQLFRVKAEVKENAELQVRLGSMVIGGVKFVFNESTAAGSRWDTFLKERGEGLEHIAFEVTDIDDACATARDLGLAIRFAEHKPMYGTLSNFIEQDGLGATIVELMEPVDSAVQA